ncbi:crotonase/enoyl-CoA hydratase family protein [Nakamurella sp. YIM 132087]|uniref:Crotonase/enoyl-CoA hydratase family protein n=1 Tax=Nakamurella alba TaxID=2665158 RepID=A0A7K1FPA9_9ACTN|nr:crotonase/enoyl-CoA hydratase family protein [Nakamurella alba]MTD15988.1 crotonase/enoyl-CoA hydratase family protein [Nakamurella alba]
MTDEPAVLYHRDGTVGVITLNRPKAMNSANAALSDLVGEYLEQIAADPEVRVGVITGTGRAFCAGMDLKAFAAGEDVAGKHPEWGFAGAAQHWIDKPLIAAVNGFAFGGGAELMLACDLAVISSTASIAVPEVKRGLFAAGGGAVRLARLLPRRLAAELLLTGRPLTAPEALAAGLVNRMVEPDELMPATLELAREIGANAPLALQVTKQVMYRSLAAGDDWTDEAWAENAAAFAKIAVSADAAEGATAFAEKRDPVWTGK